MKILHLILAQWRLAVTALILGAIIHILVTLSAAQIDQSSAYRILTRNLPPNQVAFAKPFGTKNQPLPYLDPGAFYSFCRYDASTSRIRVSAKLAAVGWSLSLHTPRGDNFYYVPGTDRRVTDVELVLEPPGNVFAPAETEVAPPATRIPVVKLPAAKGLVILRAPIKGLEYRRRADELRANFSCRIKNQRLAGRARE